MLTPWLPEASSAAATGSCAPAPALTSSSIQRIGQGALGVRPSGGETPVPSPRPNAQRLTPSLPGLVLAAEDVADPLEEAAIAVLLDGRRLFTAGAGELFQRLPLPFVHFRWGLDTHEHQQVAAAGRVGFGYAEAAHAEHVAGLS